MATDEVYRRARTMARGERSIALRRQERQLVTQANVRRLNKNELAQLVAVRAELRQRAESARRGWTWSPFSRRAGTAAVRKP
jgi:hypothetical protein